MLTLSYVFSRSIKPTYTLCFFSRAFWPICFRVKIGSTHPFSDLKPRYSSSIKSPVTLRTLSTNIPVYIFLANGSITLTFTPLPFTLVQRNNHSRSPVFKKQETTPLSKAIFHSLQILSTTMSPPPSIISPVTSFLPAAFLF